MKLPFAFVLVVLLAFAAEARLNEFESSFATAGKPYMKRKAFDANYLCFGDFSHFLANKLSPNLHSDFCHFATKFEKKYFSLAELETRLQIFQKNSRFVDFLNKIDKYAEYSVRHSPFADLSSLEFKETYLMNFKEQTNVNEDGTSVDPQEEFMETARKYFNLEVEDKNYFEHRFKKNQVEQVITDKLIFDWDKNGKVTPVKNQGAIGTCWAFSAVAVVESQLAIKKNIIKDLSVEQLVECAGNFNTTNGDADCSEFGGWPYLAYKYIESYGGLFSESDFPYCAGSVNPTTELPQCFPCMPLTYDINSCGDHSDLYCNVSTTLGQKDGGFCFNTQQNVAKTTVKVKDWQRLSSNETTLSSQLQSLGPVSVALNALPLQFYFKGVLSLPFSLCGQNLNHAVLLTGFGEVDIDIDPLDKHLKVDYWKVKNSWGTQFGENGYFRIRKNKDMCGINLWPSIASIQ